MIVASTKGGDVRRFESDLSNLNPSPLACDPFANSLQRFMFFRGEKIHAQAIAAAFALADTTVAFDFFLFSFLRCSS